LRFSSYTEYGIEQSAFRVKKYSGQAMMRSLIWVAGDIDGWGCSSCPWRFPIPALLNGEEAKAAYDRLAAVKFREHACEGTAHLSRREQETIRDTDNSFADRARKLIKQGYSPKVAVELVLSDIGVEHRNDVRMMEKARADAKFFLQEVRQGRI
jgi:hypothetical protein